MPYYDYKCESCKHVFETFHGMTETPEIMCPKCNNNAKKLITSCVGIAFKGSGFHVTDYKNSASKESEGSKTEAA